MEGSVISTQQKRREGEDRQKGGRVRDGENDGQIKSVGLDWREGGKIGTILDSD